jgi:hypothetical protein
LEVKINWSKRRMEIIKKWNYIRNYIRIRWVSEWRWWSIIYRSWTFKASS